MADKPESVMILAAGRGERMRPLTDHRPKPLLPVAGKGLIEHHIERVAAAGFSRIVINHAWLGEMIENTLGDGSRWNVTIRYSAEGEALETGGGIHRALPLLSDPFLVINGDIWADIDYRSLAIESHDLAHLVMVNNPVQHPDGDFRLERERLFANGGKRLTFSGVGLYRHELFSDCEPGRFPLAPLLREAMAQGKVGGSLHEGTWFDVGTPGRLAEIERLLADQASSK